jgi:hypothetical protein
MAINHIAFTEDPKAENEFHAGDSYIVDEVGEIDGTPDQPCKFYSDSFGDAYTLDLSVVGDLEVSYWDIRDMTVTGGTLTVVNGRNGGNNSGNIVFRNSSAVCISILNLRGA